MIRSVRIIIILAVVLVGAIVLVRNSRAPLIDARLGSKQILDRNGKLLRLTLAGDERYRLFTPLNEFPPAAVEAVLLHEDRYFRIHPGINPWSLTRAFVATFVHRGRRIGGSTITMQLARLNSSRGSKTVLGKLFQIAHALEYEVLYSKNEILEAYMNLLPYGGNVEGLGTASLIYFQKPAKDLTLPEILTLTLIPQNPNLRQLSHGPTNAFEKSRGRLAAAWIRNYPQDKLELATLDVPFQARRFSELPFLAPHFVNTVLEKTNGPEFSRTSRIETTLDLGIQQLVEMKLKRFVNAKSSSGIRNGSALVVDTRTMDIVAMVGSANFFDSAIEGQVNGVLAKRSPGSTLKPFVYALAMDQGFIHPHSLLKDTPQSFGGFDPENYDRRFAGPVNATEALISSRNVPAVYLSSLLQTPSFYDFLKSAEIAKMREAKIYGLSLSLGGGEVTMAELVRLYSMLANHGELKEIRYSRKSPRGETKRLLSKEASFLTLDMLTKNLRDDQKFVDGLLKNSRPVAWKTGTSFGFRDAWTVGLVGPFAIAVWLGNFNGEENPALVGRELAAPLFFSLVDGLKPTLPPETKWMNTRDLDIKKVRVCALSGKFENENCRNGVETWYIPGKSPIGTCNVHRMIGLTQDGHRACDLVTTVKRAVFEFWPSDLLTIFKTAGLPRQLPPAFAKGCGEADPGGLNPTIVSPRREVSYQYRVGDNRDILSDERIPFSAVSDGDVHELHWFVGAEYIGRSNPGQPLLWKPRVGHYNVRVVDEYGRSDSRILDVTVAGG